MEVQETQTVANTSEVDSRRMGMNYMELQSNIYKNKVVRKLYNWFTYGNRPNILCYPTFKCNYKCPYCNVITRGKMPERFPDEHSGKEWAEMFNKLEPSLIGFSGGELFLNVSKWSLREFLENVDKKHIIAITSNLSWDPDSVLPWLTKVRKEKRVHITFSFHESMTDIDTFIAKMKILKENGINSTISIVAAPAVIPKLDGFKDKFDKAGIRFVIHTFIDPAFKYTPEQKAVLGRYISTIRDEDNVEIPFDFDSAPTAKNCIAGKNYYVFVPNGDAYACQSGLFCVNSPVHEKWRAPKSEFDLGNIFAGTFKPRDHETKGCMYPCSEYCDRAKAKPVNVK